MEPPSGPLLATAASHPIVDSSDEASCVTAALNASTRIRLGKHAILIPTELSARKAVPKHVAVRHDRERIPFTSNAAYLIRADSHSDSAKWSLTPSSRAVTPGTTTRSPPSGLEPVVPGLQVASVEREVAAGSMRGRVQQQARNPDGRIPLLGSDAVGNRDIVTVVGPVD